MFCSETVAADALSHGLVRSREFVQNGTTPPTAAPETWSVVAFVRAISEGSVLAGTLQLPGNPFPIILQGDSDSPFLVADIEYDSQAALEAATPPGSYAMMIVGLNDLVRNVSLDFTSCAFPEAPHIVNQPDLDGLDPDAAVQVQWSPWSGGPANDFVYVEVESLDMRSAWADARPPRSFPGC